MNDRLGKVIAPLNDNRQTLKYNPYIDDAINASESKLVEKSIEIIPIATSGSGLVKASTSSAGKIIPMIGSAFMAKDLVDGYTGSSRTFKDPDIVEKLSNASASAANGLTIGLIPIDKSAKGIASIINNKYYGSLDNIVPSQEDIDRLNYINGLGKIDIKGK